MKRLLLIFTFSAAAASAGAQMERIIQPSDLKQQTIINEPVTLRKGFLRAGISMSYTVRDKYFNSSASREYRPASIWGTSFDYNLNLQYGLTERLEFDIIVPLVNNRNEGTVTTIQPVVNTAVTKKTVQRSAGIGDCRLGLLYQIIREKESRFSLTLSVDVLVPTGKKDISGIKDLNNYNLPTGEGNFRTGAGLFFRKILYPYSFSGGIAYFHNFSGNKLIDPQDTKSTGFKPGNVFDASAGFSLHLNEWIALTNEIGYFNQAKGTQDYLVERSIDSRWNLDYTPRLVFQIRRFRITQLVSIPLFGRNMDADPEYSMSVQYTF
jgi:hypothetical protein